MPAIIESPETISRNIKEWNVPVPEQEYMVLIHCSTYNHGKYIKDALEGFVGQITDFPFCAIVIDDASSDNNAAIIRAYAEQYPNIIKPICLGYNHMQNGLSRNPYFDSWHNSAKYIAQCEGDDYWIDPLKLQKQVDFLETHPEYSLCCSDASIVTERGELDWGRYDVDCQIPAKDIILGGGLWVQTASLLYRTELTKMTYPKCHVGDYPLQIFAAIIGKVYWFAEKQVVYRYQVGGSWTNMSKDTPCNERNIAGWQSEINMLREMDALSNGQYHCYFEKRIAMYVSGIMNRYRADIPKLTTIFKNEIALFDTIQKIKLFILRLRLGKIYDVLSSAYHKLSK